MILVRHEVDHMAKSPKTPRPKKGPIIPAQEGQYFDGTVGMRHERLIGRVVIAWGKVENALEDFIWQLLGLKIEIGRIITGRLDAVSKIRWIRQLSEITIREEKLHLLSRLLDDIDILREDRNLIMHASWGRDGDDVAIALSLKQTPLKPDEVVSEPFSDRRLWALSHNIDATRLRLLILMNELFPSPDTSSVPSPSERHRHSRNGP